MKAPSLLALEHQHALERGKVPSELRIGGMTTAAGQVSPFLENARARGSRAQQWSGYDDGLDASFHQHGNEQIRVALVLAANGCLGGEHARDALVVVGVPALDAMLELETHRARMNAQREPALTWLPERRRDAQIVEGVRDHRRE